MSVYLTLVRSITVISVSRLTLTGSTQKNRASYVVLEVCIYVNKLVYIYIYVYFRIKTMALLKKRDYR